MSKVENCYSLEDLATMFDTKLTAMKQVLILRHCQGDSDCSNQLLRLDTCLTDMLVLLSRMRAELSKHRKSLDSVQDFQEQVRILDNQLRYTKENIPARLPQKHAVSNGQEVTSQSHPPNSTEAPSSCPSQTNANVSTAQKPKKKTAVLPSMQYLMVDEFQTVPKYMKGRLTYSQVNAAIDELNKVLAAKYKLLATPRSGQTDPIRKKMWAYKEQETKDTKGVQFIIEQDIKDHCLLKMDSSGRAVMTILRHCGRIREIRGGGLTRFSVCA